MAHVDWKSLTPGGWHFWSGCLARVTAPVDGFGPGDAVEVVEVTDTPGSGHGIAIARRAGESATAEIPCSVLVPDLDWNNVPDPVDTLGAPEAGDPRPRAFFVTVFGRLKPVSTSRRTGEPILARDSRVWAWYPGFAEAFRVVDGNITDLHECLYEYAQVEDVPSGISSMPRREWWWKWDTAAGRWLKSVRPEDFKGVIGLSIG
jgi:hypothetical protein